LARRIRKHANPFSVRVELGLLDRRELFGREAPLEVEVGSGAGAFLLARARANPDRDFVGLEVRNPLVAALMLAEDRPRNVVFLVANSNHNLILAPPGVVQRYHVHFPDPCFKKRHWKRRVVQPATVRAMSEALPIGGEIYAQSDLLPLAEEMFRFFAADGALESVLFGFEVPRPIPESTEWERHHEAAGEPIYRMLFRKVREPTGAVPPLSLGPLWVSGGVRAGRGSAKGR
jgi:tRNA (guanine-N7-)-methyltransferase